MTHIPNNDFLTLTRQHEWHLAPFSIEHSYYEVEVWDTGVIYFRPKSSPIAEQQAFVFSSAVHGNETAPIEICDQMIQAMLNGELKAVHPVLFIFGNPASINIEKRFVEENMNRLFDGAHSAGGISNKEQQRAKELEEYVSRFYELHPTKNKTHYDLHTAIRDSAHEKFAVYPFMNGKPWKKQQFEVLRAMGVTTFMLMPTPATTFSYYSAKNHQADSFTIELGKVRPFGQNDQTKFTAAKQTLCDLITGKEFGIEGFDLSNYQMMAVSRTINKNYDDFALSFADDVANFTAFNKGDVLATEGGKDIIAEQDGEAIVFPNAKVEIGQRAILTVVPANISDNLV